MNFDDYAQPWQKKKKDDFRLPIRSNNPYFYKHHPNNWDLVMMKKGKKTVPVWLPHVTTHWLTAGVNGAQMRGRGFDDTLVKARLKDEGWNIIENDKHNYIQIYNAVGGKYYSDKFTPLEQIGKRIKRNFRSKQKEFDLFRVHLMETGDIPLPHPMTLHGLVGDCENSIERKINKQHIPEQKKKLELLQKDRELMLLAIQDLETKGIEVYHDIG